MFEPVTQAVVNPANGAALKRGAKEKQDQGEARSI
jgi:hypothetical protein